MSGRRMKSKRMAAFIQNKKGDWYQVALTDEQSQMMIHAAVEIHGGIIEVLPDKFPFELVKGGKP